MPRILNVRDYFLVLTFGLIFVVSRAEMKTYLYLYVGFKVLRTPEFTEQCIADIVSAESEATTG